jgi:3-oxoacyl-[acyl-carrier protein] reductase
MATEFEHGQRLLVTGGASGIGRSVARLAAAAGLHVCVWDLDGDGAAQVCDEIAATGAARPSHQRVDVTDESAVRAALAAEFGAEGPAFLVNNAGPASGSELSFDIGLRAAAGSVDIVTSAWLAEGRGGQVSVVNLASVAGNLKGVPPAWYSASKAAIAGYTRYLAATYGDRIRANAVAPGVVSTPRTAALVGSELGERIRSRIPVKRFGEPDEIGQVILFLLSPAATYVNGVLVPVDGGWSIMQ